MGCLVLLLLAASSLDRRTFHLHQSEPSQRIQVRGTLAKAYTQLTQPTSNVAEYSMLHTHEKKSTSSHNTLPAAWSQAKQQKSGEMSNEHTNSWHLPWEGSCSSRRIADFKTLGEDNQELSKMPADSAISANQARSIEVTCTCPGQMSIEKTEGCSKVRCTSGPLHCV